MPSSVEIISEDEAGDDDGDVADDDDVDLIEEGYSGDGFGGEDDGSTDFPRPGAGPMSVPQAPLGGHVVRIKHGAMKMGIRDAASFSHSRRPTAAAAAPVPSTAAAAPAAAVAATPRRQSVTDSAAAAIQRAALRLNRGFPLRFAGH